jgi:hypothetical protein
MSVIRASLLGLQVGGSRQFIGFSGPNLITLIIDETAVAKGGVNEVEIADLPLFDPEETGGSVGSYTGKAGAFSGGRRTDGAGPYFTAWDTTTATRFSSFFQPSNTTTNVGPADSASNYAVTVNGSAATVTNVYRRSFPRKVAWIDTSARENAAQHFVTLELSAPMTEGAAVSVAFAGVTMSTAYADKEISEAVHVSLMGYPSNEDKLGYVGVWLGIKSDGTNGSTNATLSESTAWTLRNGAGESVATGTLALVTPQTTLHGGVGTTNYNFCDLYAADFSAVTTPGTYQLEVDGVGRSQRFEIVAGNMYQQQLIDLCQYLFYQRSGQAFTSNMASGVVERPRNDHPADGLTVWQSDILCGRYAEGFTSGDVFSAIHTWWAAHNYLNLADPAKANQWAFTGSCRIEAGKVIMGGGYATALCTFPVALDSGRTYTLAGTITSVIGSTVGQVRFTGGTGDPTNVISTATLDAGGAFSITVTGRNSPRLQFEVNGGGDGYRIENLTLTDNAILPKFANPNAWGGHHDAADWDRRPQHLYQLYPYLIEMVEAIPSFRSLSLNLPESGLTYDQLGAGSSRDGDAGVATGGGVLPDIIHEVLWGIGFWRRTQDKTSLHVSAGLGSIIGGVEYSTDGMWGSPSYDPVQYAIAYGPEDWAAYNFAGCAAKLGRLLSVTLSGADGPLDAVLGARLIAEAEAAWAWAEYIVTTAPHDALSSDTNADVGAARIRAAASLFRATGTLAYATAFEQRNTWSPTVGAIAGTSNTDFIPHGYDYVRAGDEGRTVNTTVRTSVKTWMENRVVPADASDKWADYGGGVQFARGTSWYSTGPATLYRGQIMLWSSIYAGSTAESGKTRADNARNRLVKSSWWAQGCNPNNMVLIQSTSMPYRHVIDALDQVDRQWGAGRNRTGIPGFASMGCAVGNLRDFERLAIADCVYPKFANGTEQVARVPAFQQSYLTRRVPYCQEMGIKSAMQSRLCGLALLNHFYNDLPVVAPTLGTLTLSASTIAENSTPGTLVGALLGTTSSSVLSLYNDAGGRFALSGANLLAGLVSTDFETASSHNITIRETLAGATNSPRDTVLSINVSDVVEDVGFDYTITNDAEWGTIPAGILSGGGRIGVAPGNYTSKTITATPSARLTFEATDPGNMPRIDRLVLNGCARITFKSLELVSSLWANDSTNAAVLIQTGGAVDPIFDGCRILGNYRGTVGADFDVINALPEYACIAADVTGEAISSLEVTRPFVGDLMADGTHNLDFTAAGGTGATATFTVVAGFITSTNLTDGGTGYNTNSHRTRRAIWTGQRRMMDWMPWGVRTVSPGVLTNAQFLNCSWKTLTNAIKPSIIETAISVVGCDFERVFMDYMSFGTTAPRPNYAITVTDNFGTLPFSASGDAGDPHSDWIQLFMDDIATGGMSTVDWEGLTFERNIFVDGVCRGGIQGAIISDAPNEVCYSNSRFVGNLIASKALTLGLGLGNPRDWYIRNNAFIRFDPTDTVNNLSAIRLTVPGGRDEPGGYFAGGNTLVGRNITEGLETNGYGLPQINILRETNTVLGNRGTTISYATVFAGHTGSRLTRAEVIAAYTPTVGYAGQGPFGQTAYINHATRTTDLSLEPTYVYFDALTSQTASTLVTSEWSRIIGGPSTRSISITGGEWREANDAIGTGATAWTSSGGTLTRGKFLQVRQTTSASSGAETVTDVTIGSAVYNWSVTTVAAAFATVDNQATAYSRVSPVSTDTGIRKLVLAFRMKLDAVTTNANLFSDTSASSCRVWFPTTGAYRAVFWASSRAVLRPVLTPDTSMKTHFITLDFTNTNANQGCFWATAEDGVLLNNIPGTSGGTFDTRSTAGSGTDYGAASLNASGTGGLFQSTNQLGIFGEADGGGVLLDGACEFFWMDWGGSSYTIPDITNASVRNAWLSNNIGANGQGPTGSIPKLFYTGNAAAWNDAGGLANLGSLTAPLVKQAGTYV